MLDSEKELLEVLKQNPEELKHAQDTLKWLLVLKPDADYALVIAALGHDIERAVKAWEVKDYKLDKEFRAKHAKRSVETIKPILAKYGLRESQLERIYNLILNHEYGGGEADILRDADSLANFEWCDDFYGKEKTENLKSVMERMYSRMSGQNRSFISQVNFKNLEVKKMLEKIILDYNCKAR